MDRIVKGFQREPSIPQQLNTNAIRGFAKRWRLVWNEWQLLWNMDNFRETWTISWKRGRLLYVLWIRWQVLKHCFNLLTGLYPHIYIYIEQTLYVHCQWLPCPQVIGPLSWELSDWRVVNKKGGIKNEASFEWSFEWGSSHGFPFIYDQRGWFLKATYAQSALVLMN